MTSKMSCPDVLVIGAGPAGLSAAMAVAHAGLSVIVVDDQIEPGGQIWRSANTTQSEHANLLGPEYQEGQKRVREFLDTDIDYRAQTTVWQIEHNGEAPVVYCSGPEGGSVLQPKNLVIANGAVERPMPIPGWTKPGVMTGGGMQILLKSAQICPQDTVLAGGGPLLWLMATQLVKAGAVPRAIVECVSMKDYLAASPHIFSALKAPAPLIKGLKLIAQVRKAGVPVYRFARNLRVEGDTRATGLTFENAIGQKKRIETDTIGLHFGVVPNPQISRLMRFEHKWDRGQHAFHPKRLDNLQVAERTYMAGDGVRIGGADVAWLEGKKIGLLIAGKDTHAIDRDLNKAEACRPFIDRLYQPPKHLLKPTDDTVICRCEGVNAGRIRQAVRDGAMGPNQVKFMLRPGMGPCQGRVCGLAVSEIVADEMCGSMDDAGYFRIRPPLKPVPLSVIAAGPEQSSKLDAAE